ncbi:MAG: serine hydrolase domain-containing protein [Hyphomonadaceae bacterium]|nr:serine hydrolase domain-containing protein [Hyphomonadaceae bacterium]
MAMPAQITRRAVLGSAAAALSMTPAWAQEAAFASAAAYSAARRGVALVVMRGDAIVFEDYPNRGGPDRDWELASGTKSFTGIIAAAAVQDRLLRLDERAAETLAEWRNDPRKSRVTIRQLLSLDSGVAPGGIGRAPPYADAVALPAVAEPGARFSYGPGPFQIFGEIMRRKLVAARLDGDPLAYLRRRVLDPIGAAPTGWRRGPDQMPLLPQGAQFTARAWARFGRWVLRGGDGRVDAAALAANFAPSGANPGYGMSWWLLRPGLITPGPRQIMTIAPEGYAALGDVRMAAGAGDQRLYLMPERDLVVARQAPVTLRDLGGRRAGLPWDDAAFLRLLLGA